MRRQVATKPAISRWKQGAGKRHALCPGLFSQCRLLGLTSKIVLGKNAKRGKIKVFRKDATPKEDWPLAAPVFPDLIPDMSDIGPKHGFDGVVCGLIFGALYNSGRRPI